MCISILILLLFSFQIIYSDKILKIFKTRFQKLICTAQYRWYIPSEIKSIPIYHVSKCPIPIHSSLIPMVQDWTGPSSKTCFKYIYIYTHTFTILQKKIDKCFNRHLPKKKRRQILQMHWLPKTFPLPKFR